MDENILLYRGNSFDANFFHRTRMDVDHSFYLKLGRSETLLVPKLNERAAKISFKGEVRAYKKPMEEILQLIRGKHIHMDYSSLPARIYEKLRRACKPRDCSEDFFRIRARKKPEEIEKIKKAVHHSKKLFSGLEEELREGKLKSELDVNNWLLARTFELGLEPAFDPVVGSGLNSALPHYHPGHSKIKDFVLVDYGVKYGHYCSDITRVFFLKKNEKILEAYGKIQDIFYEILDAFPDFEKGKDVALLSERLFRKYGLPDPIHSIGHGVGLDIHEYPRLGKKSEDTLAGAAMAIEPAAYFKNFGVRFEETIYFYGKKARVL